MSVGHRLLAPGDSPVHRCPAHLKVLGLLGFMLLVVATPAAWYPAYGGYLLVLAVVIGVARVPPLHLLRRMVVEVPFVVFAIVLPFVAHGEQVEVLGLMVSQPGLVAAGTLLAKATLGVLAGLTLAATTEPHDLLVGLERLRLPSMLVQIMSFMVRYLDVVTDDLRRQHIALSSRGFTARNPRHWPVLARSIGALFIRSFERGERIHLAMLSRGWSGKMPRGMSSEMSNR
ncbi:cobalt ECF transporter T component CbiQ [Nocardioides daejeonensis]|uniref:cobalt ECF transporter T component CbiQ n=1 Tax=Nocardioides daejeonensis TaxID=1046556 RepID=UPI000D741B6B|nr:cobalt ECF transporter T component CbiQ [Nocardioides daejeonensis]